MVFQAETQAKNVSIELGPRIDLDMPKDGDNDVSVSSGDMESSADSGTLDMEEKYYKFDTMRERAEFTYKEIRRTALEATRAVSEHDNFMSHAKFRGPIQ